VVQTNGRPAPLDTSDHGRPIGEGRDAVAVADQHIARVHPEGAIHEVPRRRKYANTVSIPW
jgi:hypothetical protein